MSKTTSVFVAVFPRELIDDVQRKPAECFTTTASFLDGGSSGTEKDKRGEMVKIDKETSFKLQELLPSNCELQR